MSLSHLYSKVSWHLPKATLRETRTRTTNSGQYSWLLDQYQAMKNVLASPRTAGVSWWLAFRSRFLVDSSLETLSCLGNSTSWWYIYLIRGHSLCVICGDCERFPSMGFSIFHLRAEQHWALATSGEYGWDVSATAHSAFHLSPACAFFSQSKNFSQADILLLKADDYAQVQCLQAQ